MNPFQFIKRNRALGQAVSVGEFQQLFRSMLLVGLHELKGEGLGCIKLEDNIMLDGM